MGPSIRVLITGSRSWVDRQRIRDDMESLKFYYGSVTIVSGACPRGADRICEEEAERLGFTIERHPADWTKHGKRAGFVRNAEMVALHETKPYFMAIAYIQDSSKGATMTAELAEKQGILVHRKLRMNDL